MPQTPWGKLLCVNWMNKLMCSDSQSWKESCAGFCWQVGRQDAAPKGRMSVGDPAHPGLVDVESRSIPASIAVLPALESLLPRDARASALELGPAHAACVGHWGCLPARHDHFNVQVSVWPRSNFQRPEQWRVINCKLPCWKLLKLSFVRFKHNFKLN